MTKEEILIILEELETYCKTTADVYEDDIHKQNLLFRDRMLKFSEVCSEVLKLLKLCVIIEGFNKPKNCCGCPFNDSHCWCSITKGEIDRDDMTCSKECPIK